MTRSASPFKLLAAALALVMVTGVALPVVALACDAMPEQHLALASVWSGAEAPRSEMPCHGEPPAQHEDSPAEHLTACCASTGLVAVSEAALAENPGAPAVQVSTLNESPWTAPEVTRHVTYSPADEAPAGAAEGVGLHVLYGALLN